MEWEFEKKRLHDVTAKIVKELNFHEENMDKLKKELVNFRKFMWNDMSHSSTKSIEEKIEVTLYSKILKQKESAYSISTDLVKKLKKMFKSPYFARVDFLENGVAKQEMIYIGIGSFIDDESGEIVVYDWRAPISSILYDYEVGPAQYSANDYIIKGEILLKRQFKIVDSHIKYLFDSSIKIDDEILQQILSKSADNKMRNIVTSIQKEQNKIIRDEENDLLIVQGAAGSGKTSIALHRVAYLLYKYRDEQIFANNVIIFSPNDIFNDYISNVLPELGEENMQQTTFMEYAEKVLTEDLKIENINDHFEYLFSVDEDCEYQIRKAVIQYKSSYDYLQLIKNYISYLEQDVLNFNDIYFRGKIVIPKETIYRLFHESYKWLPMVKRLPKIKKRLFYLLKPIRKKRFEELQQEIKPKCAFQKEIKPRSRLMLYLEFKEVRKAIEEMITFNTYQAYLQLFLDIKLFKKLAAGTELPEDLDAICNYTIDQLKNNQIRYEDLAPYLYFKGKLEGIPNMSQIKHVVIDEAQDYSSIQYEIFYQLFNQNSLTILGDLNQTIHPLMETNTLEKIVEAFHSPNSAILKLAKSYRSTNEIVEFTKQILPNREKVQSIHRLGEKPVIIEVKEKDKFCELLSKDISTFLQQGFRSIAVICKTARESLEVHNHLKEQIDVTLITKDDEYFKYGVVVIPSYLAKGLEFDVVLIYEANCVNYHRENERNLFYTICTRALHKLSIYYTDLISPFIAEISSELYEKI